VANLAFVRGTMGSGNDESFLRGRLAMLLWLPGWLAVLWLGVWLQSWIVLAAGIPLLSFATWLIVVDPRRVYSALRRRPTKKS